MPQDAFASNDKHVLAVLRPALQLWPCQNIVRVSRCDCKCDKSLIESADSHRSSHAPAQAFHAVWCMRSTTDVASQHFLHSESAHSLSSLLHTNIAEDNAQTSTKQHQGPDGQLVRSC